jgi:hypothetical protein
VDSELAGQKHESASEQARELLIETLRAANGQMESDALDAAVAAEARLNARTVRNLRAELKDKGWLRSIPERDEHGEIQRWHVALTNAAPRARGGAISRDLAYSSQKSRALARSLGHDITGTREAVSGLPANAPEWEREYWRRRNGDT